MKHQLLALSLGSLFALSASANNEIDPGYPPLPSAIAKSAEQVRAEILAAKKSNNWMENAELGTQSRPVVQVPVQFSGKSRAAVKAEAERAYFAGEMVTNAELGTIGHL